MKPTHVFVAYAKCGQCMTGVSVDFGKNDPDDAAMLMIGVNTFSDNYSDAGEALNQVANKYGVKDEPAIAAK